MNIARSAPVRHGVPGTFNPPARARSRTRARARGVGAAAGARGHRPDAEAGGIATVRARGHLPGAKSDDTAKDHGLAKLPGTGPLLADSKMDSPSAGLTTAQALTGVLGVCLGVLGVCLGVWIYIYMDLYEVSGMTKCKGQGNGGLH